MSLTHPMYIQYHIQSMHTGKYLSKPGSNSYVMVPKFTARQLCMDLFLFVSTFAGFIATLPRCPITLRQREIKRHWIRIKNHSACASMIMRRIPTVRTVLRNAAYMGRFYMEHLTLHRRFLASAKNVA